MNCWLRQQAEFLSISRRMRVILFARLACGVLVIGLVGACATPDWGLVKCEQLGARIDRRPLSDGTNRVANICVFADGTECGTQAVYEGTCPSTASAVPISPVPVPSGESGLAAAGVFPNSLDEMVSHSPLIFIGTVGSAERYLDFAGYGEDGQPQEAGVVGGPPSMPTTDFRLEVEQVLRDDGRIAGGEPIILRIVGLGERDNEALDQMGEGFIGKRYLFLLSPNPDGRSYGPYYGPWSRLIIDGDILRISNATEDPLQFQGDVEPITLEAFIAFVKDSQSE